MSRNKILAKREEISWTKIYTKNKDLGIGKGEMKKKKKGE